MSDLANKREEALRSALGRLRLALIVCDERQELRALNARAAAIFRDESLTSDLLQQRPSHPLSSFLRRILSGEAVDAESAVVAFPSGRRYAIEPSQRSDKGAARWIILLVQPARAGGDEEQALESWNLTDRERQVARLMLRGLSNDAMAAEMGISHETIKTHVTRILEKSGCRTRAEVMAKALRG